MKVNTIGYAAGINPMRGYSAAKRIPAKNENKLAVSDIIPVSGLLGAGLMAVYFIKGCKFSKGGQSLKNNGVLKCSSDILKHVHKQ